MSELYVVATPIGNLGDVTRRAAEVLKDVDLIACEDTRRAKILLNHLAIQKPLTSFFQGNERHKMTSLVERLLAGAKIALISEAGTPNISDPGYAFVAECIRQGIPVIPVPGACSVVSALSVSGLPTDSFIFDGFLSHKSATRTKKMQSWRESARTVIYFESPHRLVASLKDLMKVLGDIRIVICREMTKKFEQIHRGKTSELIAHFEANKPRGEFVVLFNLKTPCPTPS